MTVRDTTAPLIHSVTADPGGLWPPNDKLVAVSLTVSVTDSVDATPSCAVTTVTADQPAIADDWQVAGPLSLMLRATRPIAGAWRTYTIHVECRDDAGNTRAGSTTVAVRRSQR